MFIITRNKLKFAITNALLDVESAWVKTLQRVQNIEQYQQEVNKLKEEISSLKIDKSVREEAYARKDREIEHKIGLERRRQEQELALAKREATVSLREEALKTDRARFEEQLAFHGQRFEAEVGYLKGMVGEMLERLPKVTVKQNG